MELVEQADGDEQAGEKKQGPENAGEAQGEKTEGVGKRQGPGRVAHDEDGARVKACGVFDGPDGVAVVRIAVENELAAGGPVREEVAIGRQFACNRDSEDVEDGEGKGQAGDTGDRKLGKVVMILKRRDVRLAGHGGYSTADAKVGDEGLLIGGFQGLRRWRRREWMRGEGKADLE